MWSINTKHWISKMLRKQIILQCNFSGTPEKLFNENKLKSQTEINIDSFHKCINKKKKKKKKWMIVFLNSKFCY